MFWDGIFHLFCLIVILIGLFMLFKLFFKKDVILSWKSFMFIKNHYHPKQKYFSALSIFLW